MRNVLIGVVMLLCGVTIGAALTWALLVQRPDLITTTASASELGVEMTDIDVGEYVTLPMPKAVNVKPAVSKVIYLNREGARLRAGDDDAAANTSSLVRHVKRDAVDFPAFSGSNSRWNAIVGCVRRAFAPFAVEVVDQRPLRPGYLMAMFGGHSTLLGPKSKHSHATGLAPFSGEPIAGAVVLVFSRSLKNSLRNVCQTAAMEIAHAYGLDHALHCRDFMTYKGYCGVRRFVDETVRCGEKKPRDCKRGGRSQNSHRHLLSLLGGTEAIANR